MKIEELFVEGKEPADHRFYHVDWPSGTSFVPHIMLHLTPNDVWYGIKHSNLGDFYPTVETATDGWILLECNKRQNNTKPDVDDFSVSGTTTI